MPLHERDSLYSLASFADSVLMPAVRQVRARKPAVWDLGLAVESFLWLDLGVKVGAFPEDESRELAEGIGDDITGALAALEQSNLDKLISDYHRQLLRRSLDDRDFYFVKDRAGFLGEAELPPAFETAMLMATEAARDPRTSEFFTLVNLADDNRWDHVRTDPVHVRMFRAMANGTAPVSGAAVVIATFASCIGYWIDAEAWLSGLVEDSRFDASARIGLAGNVASIQAWRLNFSHPPVRERLLLVADRALEVMSDPNAGFLLEQPSGEDAGSDLYRETTRLMERWESHMEFAVRAPVAMR